MLEQGKALKVREMQRLETIRNIYEQQKYMYDNRTHTVPNRIVSVSQPFVRPIVRGKAGTPVEFGMKLDISVVDGRGWNIIRLMLITKRPSCRIWLKRFEKEKVIILAGFWLIKFIGIGTTYGTVKSVESDFPDRHWAGRKRRHQRRSTGLQRRMRKSGSRAKVQFSKTEMWHGLGYSKTAGNCWTRYCHVNFAAESP